MTAYLDEAFAGPSWHGPALYTALRGVTPKQAAWRPGRGRHSIWELVVHAAYWKHVVRQRLSGRRAGRFPLRGTNWFVRPSGDRTWHDDVRLLAEEHERLREVVKRLPPRSNGMVARRDKPERERMEKTLNGEVALVTGSGRGLGFAIADRLAELYAAADLFVLASRFEGYGMAYAEAIAHGVPVIGTTAGAIPETVFPEAGVLVPPDDVEALTGAIRSLLERPGERKRLAAAACASTFPSWRQQAELFAGVLETLT